MLKAKGSAMTMPVCVSQRGVANNAASGDLPVLLLSHSSALRTCPSSVNLKEG